MRILIVTQYFWPEVFRVNDLVEGLVERGHAVTILTGRPNYPEGRVFPEFREDPAKFSEFAGCKVVRVPMLARGASSIRLFLNYLVFALSASVVGPWLLRGRPFDAIFVFEPSPISIGIPAAVLRWLKKAPVVFWVLDLWPESLSATGMVKSKAVLAGVGRVVRFVYDHCDVILAQSRSFIPQIRRFGQAADKVVYFPSWADKSPDGPPAEPAAEVPRRSDIFTVVFTGNIGEAQDFPAILDAAERLKHRGDIRWVFVGDGRMASWVRSEIEARGLAERVQMPGRFPLARMASFYAHADALLVSLKAEPIFALTLPGKLQSYLAEGLPILAMLDGEGADVVRNAGCGLAVPAGAGAALAQAVIALAEMPEEDRRNMGLKGMDLSRGEFDRDRQIDALVGHLHTARDAFAATTAR